MVEYSEYVTLFARMVKGMVEKPIPDEITVVTMGAQVADIDLPFFVSFAAIYTAVSMVLVAGYIVGTVVRARFVHWLVQRGMIPFTQDETKNDANRYLGWLLCLGFFFPVVRHLVPFIVGVARMPLRQFILFYIPSSLVWTFHYYLAGYWFADRMDDLVAGIYTYSKITLAGLCLVGVTYLLVQKLRRVERCGPPPGEEMR
ncbi:DedA family protein [Brevibacillus sp. NRS-1366]|uniref:DedA family protein n=1 Tax=Brevibacillus sp. NRS-1366 TaxID=3233899 RepID=UPI003D22AC40